MATRGCGKRQRGGIYLRTLLEKCDPHSDPRCKPIEWFLLDPPIPKPENLDIPNRGVLILERPDGSGVYDVFDRVGSKNYPNVADFIEETRRFGLSRRIGRGADLAKLTSRSLIFLLHERAVITNARMYWAGLLHEVPPLASYVHPFRCPCGHTDHTQMVVTHQAMKDPLPTCAGLWYEDVQGGKKRQQFHRGVTRQIGDTSYSARSRPEIALTPVVPEYQEGIFLRLPLHRLDVIRDPVGHEDEKAMLQAVKSALPVELEDE